MLSRLTLLLLAAGPLWAAGRSDPTPEAAPMVGAGVGPEFRPVDLAGSWRLDLYLVMLARIPVLGESALVSHQIAQVTLAWEGNQLIQHQKICDVVAVAQRSIGQTRIPAAFVAALPEKHVPILLRPGPTGWRYDVDLLPQVMGMVDDPAVPVPQDDGDPNVRDTDKDGQPGVTVQISAPLFGKIDVYMVQRAHTRLSGELLDLDRIAGSGALVSLDQRTIGASNRLFAANPKITPDNEHTRFELTRLDAPLDCAAIRALNPDQ